MDKWKIFEGKAVTACGGVLEDASRYPSRKYKGKRVYFCNEDCLREFEKNPDGFMSGEVPHPIGQE